jgi:hypothetical protein
VRDEKKFSAQFRNHQPGLYDDQLETSGGENAKKDDILSWQEELVQDPYVAEAKNILIDMK